MKQERNSGHEKSVVGRLVLPEFRSFLSATRRTVIPTSDTAPHDQ